MYLGTPESPVPFGGRDRQIEALNKWISNNQSEETKKLIRGDNASCNLLVTAPAGRGKTALLIRWIRQLPKEFQIVFVPISIRANTNLPDVFYSALASRLAEIVGEFVPESPRADPAPYYREKVIELFDRVIESGIPTLVVIDGLDEAAGWKVDRNVLPLRSALSLHVVISARELADDDGPANWLDRIGWSSPQSSAYTMAVPPLDQDGIADVLRGMSFPIAPLSESVDIVKELHNLTEHGDPLLLQLYTEDLLQHGDEAPRFQPEDLRNLEPGFGKYFKRWLSEQRDVWKQAKEIIDEEFVDAMLAVLASAHGPIPRAVLENVVYRIYPGNRVFSARTIGPLARFLVGDGVKTGYVLTHPKLGDFLREEYFGSGGIIKACITAFSEWAGEVARDVNSGKLKESDVPEYALVYATRHFAMLNLPESLHAYRELIEDGWRRAWEAREQGFQGFSRDVEIAAQAFRDASIKDPSILIQERIGLGAQFRCMLCLSSIRSIGLGIPTTALVDFLENGDILPKQALYLSLLKKERERADSLKGILPFLSSDLCQEAHAAARDILDHEARAQTLLVIATKLPSREQTRAYQECLRAAYRIESSYWRGEIVGQVKQCVPEEVWGPIVDAEEYRIKMNRSIEPETPFLADSTSNFDDKTFREMADRVRFLEHGLERPESDDSQLDVLRQLLKLSAQEGGWLATHVIENALSQMPPRVHERLLSLLDQMSGFYDEDRLLLGLGKISDENLVEKAALIALKNLRFTTREDTLDELWSRLGKERKQRIFDLIVGMDDEWDMAGILGKLAGSFDPEQLKAALARCFSMGYSRVKAFVALLEHLPEPLLREAFNRTQFELNIRDRADFLEILANRLPDDLLEPAFMSARELDTIESRGRVLARLLPRLRKHGLREAVTEAFRAAFVIGDRDCRTLATACLLPNLERDYRLKAEQKLVAEIEDMPKNLDEDRIMLRLVLLFWMEKNLSETNVQDALRAAISAAEGVQDDLSRAMMLVASSVHVDSNEASRYRDEALTLIRNSRKDELAIPLAISALFFSEHQGGALLNEAEAALANSHDEKSKIGGAAIVSYIRLIISGTKGTEAIDKIRSVFANLDHPELKSAAFLPILKVAGFICAPQLPEEFRREMLDSILNLLEIKDDPEEQVVLLSALASYLDDDELATRIGQYLEISAVIPRPIALGCFSLLQGVTQVIFPEYTSIGGNQLPGSPIERLGGPAAVRETIEAIQDVCEWWP